MISGGKIRLNGAVARSSRKIAGGDRIEYDTAGIVEPEVDGNFQIIFSDEHLIVVSKPGNLPCHPSGPFFKNTLWHMLAGKFGKTYFVNRIDRETSGLVIIARSPRIASEMSESHADIRKKYIAVVHGRFPADCHARGFMCADTASAIRKKRRFYQGPQAGKDDEYSEGIFKFLESKGGLSIVEVELVTGRLHQIRATLSFLGFPLVGDKIYGLDENFYLRFIEGSMTDEDKVKLMIGRQALHSSSLEFTHPVNGEDMLLNADLPEDMKNLINKEG
ncbi:MAG: hypothetical protein A2X48_17500 [Lentisphaerae bacterium GWF2_49_21]|nr:MAG: hypothetical protein A2X48_17500 [Lentisphaerae bacterium GWF2_49_21]